MAILKHVGKYGEKPCVIIFREIPNEPENCLIVQTGNLSEVQHDDLMMVVQSAEAQESNDISQVLHRRQFKTGDNMLSTLHYNKLLQKVPVSHVSLTPTPSQSLPLAEVNAEIRKIEGGYVPPKNDESHIRESVTEAPAVTEKTESVDDPSAAQSLLFQANLMEEDAKQMLAEAEAKRQEAYALDASLKPEKKRGRPKASA